MNEPIVMSVPQMQEAASSGAFVGFVGGNVGDQGGRLGWTDSRTPSRKIGPEFCILSSDLGQKGNPAAGARLRCFLAAMRARGLSEQDVDRMSRRNPRRCWDCSSIAKGSQQ